MTQPANLGICSTCDNLPHCFEVRQSQRPIWHCNEFDVGPPIRSGMRMEEALPFAPDEQVSRRNVPPGICSNCDNLTTCSLPKPNGGVWRCEEYR